MRLLSYQNAAPISNTTGGNNNNNNDCMATRNQHCLRNKSGFYAHTYTHTQTVTRKITNFQALSPSLPLPLSTTLSSALKHFHHKHSNDALSFFAQNFNNNNGNYF